MFWKIHFFLYAAINAALAVLAAMRAGPTTFTWDAVLAMVLGLVGIIPLYGNAFNKAIGWRTVWALVALALLVLDFIIPLLQLLQLWDRLSFDHSRWTLIAGELFVLLLAIYFIAMVRYIFFRPGLWKES